MRLRISIRGRVRPSVGPSVPSYFQTSKIEVFDCGKSSNVIIVEFCEGSFVCRIVDFPIRMPSALFYFRPGGSHWMPLLLIRRSALLAHLRGLDSISPTVLPAQIFILSESIPVNPLLKVLSPIITVTTLLLQHYCQHCILPAPFVIRTFFSSSYTLSAGRNDYR